MGAVQGEQEVGETSEKGTGEWSRVRSQPCKEQFRQWESKRSVGEEGRPEVPQRSERAAGPILGLAQ